MFITRYQQQATDRSYIPGTSWFAPPPSQTSNQHRLKCIVKIKYNSHQVLIPNGFIALIRYLCRCKAVNAVPKVGDVVSGDDTRVHNNGFIDILQNVKKCEFHER